MEQAAGLHMEFEDIRSLTSGYRDVHTRGMNIFTLLVVHSRGEFQAFSSL